MDGERARGGTSEVTGDGHDNNSRAVKAGIYFLQMDAGPYRARKALVTLR